MTIKTRITTPIVRQTWVEIDPLPPELLVIKQRLLDVPMTLEIQRQRKSRLDRVLPMWKCR